MQAGGGWCDGVGASSLVGEAVRCAERWHRGQRRASDDGPFIAHPLEVARLLCAGGAADEVVAAGVLHDVLEKTGVTARELEDRFGSSVAGLVQTVTVRGDATASASGKRELRARVEAGGDDVALLLAADVISKLRELRRVARRDPTRFGAESTDRGVRVRLEHYVACARMLRRRMGAHRLVVLLDDELSAYFGEPGRGGASVREGRCAHDRCSR